MAELKAIWLAVFIAVLASVISGQFVEASVWRITIGIAACAVVLAFCKQLPWKRAALFAAAMFPISWAVTQLWRVVFLREP